MNLGVIIFRSELKASDVTLIDRICRGVWEMPHTVRVLNVPDESTLDSEIENWVKLYFGCSFVDNYEEGETSKRLSRLISPRINISPRKYSGYVIDHLYLLSRDTTHIIIVGLDANIYDITKVLEQKILIIV
jgi:hypothetical protein